MLQQANEIFRFDGYTINRADWTLHHAGERIALNRRSFDLLLYLLAHRERVVSKDELLEAVWAGQVVEESNLTQQIFLLRKALSKHPSGLKIIETVPGRGYRFVAALEAGERSQHGEGLEQIVVSSSILDTATREAVEEREDDLSSNGSLAGALCDEAFSQSARSHSSLLGQNAARDGGKHGSAHLLNRVMRRPLTVTLVGVAVALALLTFLALRRKASPKWHVSAYRQITTDGGAKQLGSTDGSRIYFTQLQLGDVEEVSASGGLAAPIKIGLKDAWAGDISPNGSTLLVISQAGGQGPASSLWSLNLIGGTLRHIADAVLCSAWLPDGERIVYASITGDIFVVRRDGSEKKKLASVGGYVKSIAWSPTSDKVRFSKDGLLWEMAADGTDVHQLLPGWGQSPSQWSGTWSPDGRYSFVADNQLWLLENNTGLHPGGTMRPSQLTSGPTVWDQPLSDRDGKRILASGRTRRGELVRWDVTSKEFRPFLAGISADFVVFSKDGRSVAYVSFPQGILWRANMDGSNPVQLTESPIYPKSLCWSPDGSQIAFVDHSPGAKDAIFLIATDASGKPQRILPRDNQAETDPSWSPDGKSIAFSTSPNVGASATADLQIFDLQTREAMPVPHSAGLLVPRWSPDGRSLAAMTLDTFGLKILNLSSQTWTSLNTGAIAFPQWSHDGRWIYYVRWTSKPAILRVNAETGKLETVAELTDSRYTGTYTLWMGLDPADEPMMLRDEGTDDIYSLVLERD